jgi:hypothetical protein
MPNYCGSLSIVMFALYILIPQTICFIQVQATALLNKEFSGKRHLIQSISSFQKRPSIHFNIILIYISPNISPTLWRKIMYVCFNFVLHATILTHLNNLDLMASILLHCLKLTKK